jgi:hypothetical protein
MSWTLSCGAANRLTQSHNKLDLAAGILPAVILSMPSVFGGYEW